MISARFPFLKNVLRMELDGGKVSENFGEKSIALKCQKLTGAFNNVDKVSEELLSQNVHLVRRVKEFDYACSLALTNKDDFELKMNELSSALTALTEVGDIIVKQNGFLLEHFNSRPDSHFPTHVHSSSALATGEEDGSANDGHESSSKWEMLKKLFSDITGSAELLSSQNTYLSGRLKEINHEFDIDSKAQNICREGDARVQSNAHKCYQIREAFEEAIINLETLAVQNVFLMQLWKESGSYVKPFECGDQS